MGKLYYTLIERVNGKWSPQFGDYSKAVVKAEAKEYIEQGTESEDLAIIHSGDSQEEINSAVAQMN